MSKKNIKRNRENQNIVRERLKRIYLNKYYNDFMSKYKIEGIGYKENYFVFRKFWYEGTVACWNIKNTDLLGFAPYTVQGDYDYLDFPSDIRLVKLRPYGFIPDKTLIVDEEAVIGWAQRNHRPVCELVVDYVDRLVDIDMIIKKNLKAQKTPWLIATSAVNEQKINEFYNALDSDEDALFFTFEEGEKPSALVSGAPYIIDKLNSYKQCLTNELLTFLGLNNIGIQEKKEHLINSEVEANNEVVSQSEDNFIVSIEEFINNINKTFNKSLKLVCADGSPLEEEMVIDKEEPDEI